MSVILFFFYSFTKKTGGKYSQVAYAYLHWLVRKWNFFTGEEIFFAVQNIKIKLVYIADFLELFKLVSKASRIIKEFS